MDALLHSLLEFLIAGWQVFTALIALLLPWIPLAVWVGFWLFGVNWLKLRQILLQGGLIGVLLIGLVMILVWGMVAPPPDGYHYLFGLQLSNFVGKTVYVTSLFAIMFLCGAVQLSGCCEGLTPLDESEETAAQRH